MQVLRGGHVAFATLPRVFELTIFQQILLVIGIILTAGASLFLTNSLIPFAVVACGAIMFAVIRNGVSSLFALIIINIILTLRTKEAGINGAPSFLDLVLGIMLVSIIGYWVIRLRFL